MANFYYFKKYFSREFILVPEIVRQIDSVLKSFVEIEQLNLALEYHIFKDVGGYYVTSDIGKLLAEPNSKSNRISRIDIRVGREETTAIETPVFIECRFTRDRLLRCKVEIQDYRSGNSQQHLADCLCELFDHTQKEASINIVTIPDWLKSSLTPSLMFFIILLWLRRYPFFASIKLADLSIIDFPLYVGATVIVYTLFISLWQKTVNLPHNFAKDFRMSGVFLWGSETHDFPRRAALQKLIWGIGIGLIVGVTASLIAAWLTSN